MSNLQSFGGCSSSQNIYASKEPPIYFLIMRFSKLKLGFLLLTSISLFTIVFLYSIFNADAPSLHSDLNTRISSIQPESWKKIICDINGKEVDCKRDGPEIYVPFYSFLQKDFEVYGKLSNDNRVFKWAYSYSKVFHPKTKYDPKGVYMYFENYNVEVRDRVKCVSATDGVPVSTQWETQGYYYPTQIAQFGLSHYSKNLTDPEPRVTLIEDASEVVANWVIPQTANIQRYFYKERGTKILEFKTSERYNEGINLHLDYVLDFVIKMDVFLNGNSSLTVELQNRETKDSYLLHYITTDVLITIQDINIYHGVGTTLGWKTLTRDLVVDLQKGLNYASKEKTKQKIVRSKLKIINITLRGSGLLDNLTLSSSEHMQQFYDAAEWFVKFQDPETGGWPIPVKRKLAQGFVVLKPGWYSAMGQGHAISVLSRAFYHSGGDERYLKAAINGLKPFRVLASDGGVLATFLNRFHWYEEYPTDPPSFVLNGFIYSLLGLYDLMNIAPVDQSQEAEFLYNDGVTTLKQMLPLFDMGSVTAYDLRHFTLGIAPNLARWDYHATHINQLLLLSTIEDEPLFSNTAERWIGYMNGKKADHN